MSLDLSFKILQCNNIVLNNVGKIRCDICGEWTLITFSKSLLCNKCKSVLSEYASHVIRTINSRLIYYNSKK